MASSKKLKVDRWITADNFFNRSLSCFFILTFHLFWFSFYATSNPGVMFHLSEQARFQWIANAALMVDCFFTIRQENQVHRVGRMSHLLFFVCVFIPQRLPRDVQLFTKLKANDRNKRKQFRQKCQTVWKAFGAPIYKVKTVMQ